MYLALVRNECFYKIHKRKTYFSLQKPQMTPLLYSLFALAPLSKLVESEGPSFPLSFEKKNFFLLSFLPLCPVLSGKGNLGLAVSGSPRNTFADREWLARIISIQARSSQQPVPQRSGCGYSDSLGSRSSWMPSPGRMVEGEGNYGLEFFSVLRICPAAWPLDLSRPFSLVLTATPWSYHLCSREVFLWTPRGDVSEPEESDSPSQLPSTTLTSPRPYPLLRTGPLGCVLPGCVQGKTLLRAGATAL